MAYKIIDIEGIGEAYAAKLEIVLGNAGASDNAASIIVSDLKKK